MSLLGSIYTAFAFVSIQLISVIWLGYLIHSHLRQLLICKFLLPFSQLFWVCFCRSFLSLLYLCSSLRFSFIVPIFAWNVPLVSLIFLTRSLVFPILLFYSISLHWSLRKAGTGTLHSNGYIFPFLLCLSLPFFPQLFVRPPQAAILPFCIYFSWGYFWFLSPIQCHEPLHIVHQALCLSDLVP